MMKRNLLSFSFMFAAALAFSTSAYAQHGGGGGGRPAGAGMGPAGAPAGVGSQASGRPTDAGNGGMGHASMASQSPTTAFENSHATTALSNALTKSGITVPGGSLQSACSGFKTLGQCVAALHVAKNLNLSFSDLQNKMASESLGKAIQDLGGPNVNAKGEAKKAEKQANQDLNTAASAS
jgi:hypothetical protein